VHHAKMAEQIKIYATSSYNTHHCLDVSQSVFLMDSHHPLIETLADACRKTLPHLTAAQPAHVIHVNRHINKLVIQCDPSLHY